MTKAPLALCIEHLTLCYNEQVILWDLSLAIPSGKLVGILGPNGAGKSSLLKTILGLNKALSGSVEFLGEPLSQARKKVAYVPQKSSVDWDFPATVFEVVEMGLYNQSKKWFTRSKEQRIVVEGLLEQVGLLALASQPIRWLSVGQQQRLFFARALAQKAQIYFMDEPFAGVDALTEKELLALLRSLQKEGKTIFLVHHDLSTVTQYFDWIILLNQSVIASGPMEELFTSENIAKTYGKGEALLSEAINASAKKIFGCS